MKLKYFIFVILLFVITIFYLKQQVYIIRTQYKIKELCDLINVIEEENKKIVAEIEELKAFSRLEEYAVKWKYSRPKEEDVVIIHY